MRKRWSFRSMRLPTVDQLQSAVSPGPALWCGCSQRSWQKPRGAIRKRLDAGRHQRSTVSAFHVARMNPAGARLILTASLFVSGRNGPGLSASIGTGWRRACFGFIRVASLLVNAVPSRGAVCRSEPQTAADRARADLRAGRPASPPVHIALSGLNARRYGHRSWIKTGWYPLTSAGVSGDRRLRRVVKPAARPADPVQPDQRGRLRVRAADEEHVFDAFAEGGNLRGVQRDAVFASTWHCIQEPGTVGGTDRHQVLAAASSARIRLPASPGSVAPAATDAR